MRSTGSSAMFDASDLPKHISWKEFMRRATSSSRRRRRSCARRFRSAGSGRTARRTCPSRSRCHPTMRRNILRGLQTQSGKLEFECNSLKRFNDPERPPIVKYEPSWEGAAFGELFARYPLQLLTPHSKYSSTPRATARTLSPQHRRPPRQCERLLLLGPAPERGGCGRAQHQETRSRQSLQ